MLLRVFLTLPVFASCQLLRGSAADEEPLLRPAESAVAWQISGLTSKKKIPMQLVLTSKLPEGRGLAPGVRGNVIRSVAIDPELRIRWVDDDACLKYFTDHFEPAYADMLRKERRGSFRGDMCRAAVLYREGGFYTDLDLQLHVPVSSLVADDTTFMSAITADESILNALIATAPRSPVMRETLKEMLKIRRGQAPERAQEGEGTGTEWFGPLTMFRGLKAVMRKSCPDAANMMIATSFECSREHFKFYREQELDCFGEPSQDCPEVRANSEFSGLKFGIYDVSDQDRRLVAWPRYDGCKDWGCQSGGWDESEPFGSKPDVKV